MRKNEKIKNESAMRSGLTEDNGGKYNELNICCKSNI